MIPLPTRTPPGDCWNAIGVRGDRSCPELWKVVHCQNCPVFAAAGRHFLDAPSPPGYLEEWTERLAAPVEEAPAQLLPGETGTRNYRPAGSCSFFLSPPS